MPGPHKMLQAAELRSKVQVEIMQWMFDIIDHAESRTAAHGAMCGLARALGELTAVLSPPGEVGDAVLKTLGRVVRVAYDNRRVEQNESPVLQDEPVPSCRPHQIRFSDN